MKDHKTAIDIISEDVAGIAGKYGKEFAGLEGNTLLITGAAGFLGSYMVDLIAELNRSHFKKPCQVIAADNFITGFPENLAHLKSDKNVSMLKIDVSKPLDIEKHIDYCIHAASIASPAFYRKYPFETMSVNALGTWHLLELCKKHKVKSFMLMSTSEVYGDPFPQFIPTSEEYWGNVSSIGPRACYDESKRFAETISVNYFAHHNLPVKITRTFNVYGPRMHLKDKRVIPDLLSNVLYGHDIVLFSDGKATRSFCYVADALAGYFKVLLSDFNGEVFNVGNDSEEISMTELAKMIVRLTNPKLKVLHQTNPDKNYLKDNPQRRCPGLAKIKTKLGYMPNYSLEEGLKRTILWHKLNSGQ